MIGIFGGTFDPIHHGHLRVALDVAEALSLDQVRFVPLHGAVHRGPPLASSQDRLAMIKAAIADEPRFVADDRELRRGGDSYTVDTLQALRDELGPERPLCLLLGDDAFAGLPGWREPERIMDLAHLVVMQRPGHELSTDGPLDHWLATRRNDDPAALANRPAGHIQPVAVTQLDISATDIRARIAAGNSPRYLLPRAVVDLIEQHHLYANPGA